MVTITKMGFFVHNTVCNIMAGFLALALAVGAIFTDSKPARAAAAAEVPHAVVLMYHRFGESDLPSTNIQLNQLEAHIAELNNGAFNVWPLDRIINSVKAKEPLPDRTIAITIDDAYASVYHQAWPRFKAANLPFTIFVSTDQVGRSANYLTWDQIREMQAAGVLIGHHGAAHDHMANATPTAISQDLFRANKAFQDELGEVPKIFAYPYGEASLVLRKQVKQAGFIAALGQHSGVVNTSDDILYLPRFALNEAYGNMDRFQLAANALPIPTKDVSPAEMLVTDNPPAYGFTLASPVAGIARLNCFASHIPTPVRTEHLGPNRIEVRFEKPFPPGRSRINCTMRGKDGRWRWLGRLFYLPKK
jgi:poly-beta-1,6-N-acetyl-D-glucosamine N-deacetylase